MKRGQAPMRLRVNASRVAASMAVFTLVRVAMMPASPTSGAPQRGRNRAAASAIARREPASSCQEMVPRVTRVTSTYTSVIAARLMRIPRGITRP